MELFLDRLSPGRSELALAESLPLQPVVGEEAETAQLSGQLSVDNMDQKILVHGQFEVQRTMLCHRCGEPCEQRYTASLELLVLRAPGRGRTQSPGEEDNWVIHATGGVVDLGAAVREAVYLDEPILVQCAGGCSLPAESESDSEAAPEAGQQPIDPRWEKLRQLRDAQSDDDEDRGGEE